MRFVFRLDSEIQILCDVKVLLDDFLLTVLVSNNLDLESTKNLAQGARVVMEEGFA